MVVTISFDKIFFSARSLINWHQFRDQANGSDIEIANNVSFPCMKLQCFRIEPLRNAKEIRVFLQEYRIANS